MFSHPGSEVGTAKAEQPVQDTHPPPGLLPPRPQQRNDSDAQQSPEVTGETDSGTGGHWGAMGAGRGLSLVSEASRGPTFDSLPPRLAYWSEERAHRGDGGWCHTFCTWNYHLILLAPDPGPPPWQTKPSYTEPPRVSQSPDTHTPTQARPCSIYFGLRPCYLQSDAGHLSRRPRSSVPDVASQRSLEPLGNPRPHPALVIFRPQAWLLGCPSPVVAALSGRACSPA